MPSVRFISLALGFSLLGIALLTLGNPDFCASGCGNLTELIFYLLYSAFGHWGPHIFLIVVGLFFVGAGLRNKG